MLIGYGQNSKSYRCYHRASHKVIESYHVVFIESKDDKEIPFRPGTTQGLDDESSFSPLETPNPTPRVIMPPNLITPITDPTPVPDPAPAPTPELTRQPPPVQPIRRSARVSTISSRSAEASGLHKLSAVQRATAESIASKARLDAEKHTGHHSRKSSAAGEKHAGRHSRRSSAAGETASPSSQPDSLSHSLPDLAELAFKAIDELSESQTTAVMEQLYGDGYEWGLPSDAGTSYSEEPCTFTEAMASPDAPKWLAACNDELKSIRELGVFKLVPRATADGRSIMDGKFVFKHKRDGQGTIVRWKVRFVVKGYAAIYGVDYTDTAAPTMRMETFRAVAHIAAVNSWELHQVDIVTAFLRGRLEPGEEVYMKQPKGFEEKGKEDYIWELQRGLYGLPQGGRIWNKAMNAGMVSLGFTRIKCEYCLYYRKTDTGIILTGIHVDDFLLAASCAIEASSFKHELSSIWEIKDLGESSFCIGIRIERDLASHHIYLSQTSLIDKVLMQFNMVDCNPVSTPMETGLTLSRHSDVVLTREEESELKDLPYRQLVGLLMYLAIATHPDIALAMAKLSQFLAFYNFAHWNAAKRVLRYLKGTRTLKLRLGGSVVSDLLGFSDASHACCPDSGKSVGAYCFFLGNGGAISWAARKQKTVAQSTCDTEYIAISEAARECMWLHMLTEEVGYPQSCPTPLLTDNKAAKALSKDPRFHSRAKHINTKWHYIRECTENGDIHISYVPTADNVADILTKPLPPQTFLRLQSFLGLYNWPQKTPFEEENLGAAV